MEGHGAVTGVLFWSPCSLTAYCIRKQLKIQYCCF